MPNEQKVCVMALSPELQLTLRLLLKRHLKIQIRYVMDFVVANRLIGTVEKRWNNLITALDTYDELTGTFPTPETISRAQTKLFAYNALAMSYIATAVAQFRDDDSSAIAQDELEFVRHNYEDLKDLVEKSRRYEYTTEEIKRANR